MTPASLPSDSTRSPTSPIPSPSRNRSRTHRSTTAPPTPLPTMCSLLSQSQILPLLPRSMSPAVDSLRISMNSRPFRPKQTGRCSMKVLLDRMVRFSRLLRRCNRRRVLLSESGEGRWILILFFISDLCGNFENSLDISPLYLFWQLV